MKIEHFSVPISKTAIATYFEKKLKSGDDMGSAIVVIVLLMTFIGGPAFVAMAIKEVLQIEGPEWTLLGIILFETIFICVLLYCLADGISASKRLHKMLRDSSSKRDMIDFVMQSGLVDDYMMVAYILLCERFLYAREDGDSLYVYYDTYEGHSVYKVSNYCKMHESDAKDFQIVVGDNGVFVTDAGYDVADHVLGTDKLLAMEG